MAICNPPRHDELAPRRRKESGHQMITLFWAIIIAAVIFLILAKRYDSRKKTQAENAAKAEAYLLKLCGIDEKERDDR
jgi:uncharacterized protein YpmB